jgi:hypothetical protein
MVTCKNIQFFPCKFECQQLKTIPKCGISTKYFNIFISCIHIPEFESLQKQSFFSFPKCPICPFGPSSLLVSGCYRALILAVRQLGCEANHYLCLVPRLKMTGAIPLFPLYVIMCTGTTLPYICCIYETTV